MSLSDQLQEMLFQCSDSVEMTPEVRTVDMRGERNNVGKLLRVRDLDIGQFAKELRLYYEREGRLPE